MKVGNIIEEYLHQQVCFSRLQLCGQSNLCFLLLPHCSYSNKRDHKVNTKDSHAAFLSQPRNWIAMRLCDSQPETTKWTNTFRAAKLKY